MTENISLVYAVKSQSFTNVSLNEIFLKEIILFKILKD